MIRRTCVPQLLLGPRSHAKLRLDQRPTARDLLKHKFIRMAKKTSYLTELIERHERWRAEGGERNEEEERHHVEDLYVALYTLIRSALFITSTTHHPPSGTAGPTQRTFGTLAQSVTPARWGAQWRTLCRSPDHH